MNIFTGTSAHELYRDTGKLKAVRMREIRYSTGYGTDHLAWALLWSLLLPAASWMLLEQPCQVWRRRVAYPGPQPASRPLTVFT